MPDPTYDLREDSGKVRLLVNDIAAPWVFTDEEIQAFLELEGGNVKRAAAQAIDTNADNELLASKVLRTQDVQTDGAKVADAMRKHAEQLRTQADDESDRDNSSFTLVSVVPGRRCGPELTERPAPCRYPFI